MNLQLAVSPLPFPALLNDLSALKLVLGVALFIAGLIVFSLWKEKLFSIKEEERAKFLMFNFVGGTWVIAVFSVCGGLYFLVDSIMQFTA